MREKIRGQTEPQVTLKTREKQVNPSNPWEDDLIGRDEIAQRLTQVVQTAHEPLSLSIHGPWGTGKTFLLLRWQRELQNKGFRAIYFNAWEDDFQKDPLLSILGQLQQQFKEPLFQEVIQAVRRAAGPLLQESIGITLQNSGVPGIQLLLNTLKFRKARPRVDLISEYEERNRTRTELSKALRDLAEKVHDTTQKPLVFIIDELDRCRPKYAVEFLERVKHLMETPGTAFVFGIDREQLCQTIRAVQGDIDASTYLQRFFELEFNLPEIDRSKFCWVKLDEMGISQFFTGNYDGENRAHWHGEYSSLQGYLPAFCKDAGLSLREIEHCVRMIALAITTMDQKTPQDIGYLEILPILKIKNQELYRELVQGKTRTIKVIKYLEDLMNLSNEGEGESVEQKWVDIELLLIVANVQADGEAVEQMNLAGEGKIPTHPELLSDRLKRNVGYAKQRWASLQNEYRMGKIPSTTMMSEQIDLYQVPNPL